MSANLATIEIKAFVPAKDFELSKRFYEELGFTKASDSHGVAYFFRDESSFLLQDEYIDALASNLVLHLLVRDVDAWSQHVRERDLGSKYGVQVTELVAQPWGMREFFVSDPSGVRWRIAQNTR